MSNFNNLNASTVNVNTLNANKINIGSIAGTIDSLIVPTITVGLPIRLSVNTKNLITKLITVVSGSASIYLSNGIPGQLKIIILCSPNDHIILTPDICSGFINVLFNNIGDTVTLIYIDNIIGWVVQSNYGCAVNTSDP